MEWYDHATGTFTSVLRYMKVQEQVAVAVAAGCVHVQLTRLTGSTHV